MQARTGVQAAAFEGLDLVEDAQAALHHQAQLPARAAGQAVHQGAPLYMVVRAQSAQSAMRRAFSRVLCRASSSAWQAP